MLGFEAVVASPKLAMTWGPLAFKLVPERQEVESITDGLHYQKAINRMKMGNLEVCFAVDENFANFKQAWMKVVDLVDQLVKQQKYPMNMAMNARFIKGSDVLIAPSAGNPQDADRFSCYIEILSYYKTPGWREFEAQVGDEWMNLKGARPHWAKTFESIPNIVARTRAAYGDRLKRFVDIRRDQGVESRRHVREPAAPEDLLRRVACAFTPSITATRERRHDAREPLYGMNGCPKRQPLLLSMPVTFSTQHHQGRWTKRFSRRQQTSQA